LKTVHGRINYKTLKQPKEIVFCKAFFLKKKKNKSSMIMLKKKFTPKKKGGGIMKNFVAFTKKSLKNFLLVPTKFWSEADFDYLCRTSNFCRREMFTD